MNHQPWNKSTVISRFDALVKTKTTKTLCGKRVAINSADANEPIECVHCQKIMEADQRALRELESLEEPKATYTATWDQTGNTIYTQEPPGNLYGHLPLGAKPVSFAEGSDPWNGAHFSMPPPPDGSGRTLTVRRDR